MDSIIPLGQKNTLAEYMILSGADNRPPMLDKDLTKKYAKLSVAEKIQVDCDMKATNIILQGLTTDIYSLVNHHRVAKDLWERVHLLMQVNTKFLNNLPPKWSKFVTDVKLVKDLHTTNFDQLHAYLEQHELYANKVRLLRERNQDPLAFGATQQMIPPHFNTYQSSYNNPELQQQSPPSYYGSIHPNQHYSSTYPSQPQFNHSSVPPSYPYQSQMNRQTSSFQEMIQLLGRQGQSYSGTGYKSNATSSGGNNASGHARIVKCYNCQGERHMTRQCTKPKRPRNAAWYKDKAMLAEAQEARQILVEEQLIFLADPGVPNGQAVRTIILNNAAFQTEDLDTYDSDCDNILNAKACACNARFLKQTPAVDLTDYEIHSDSNIIPYSQYLQETQQINVQDTNLQAQQDSMILSDRTNVRTNDNHSHEKMIDSQMDDMIKEKLALKEQVDSLEQNLSKQIKEKECLLQTFTVFKSESKEKEDKYMKNEIDLEKKIVENKKGG
ncbi:hypothetical protein Tco_0466038 [Tanacetum coccineum]